MWCDDPPRHYPRPCTDKNASFSKAIPLEKSGTAFELRISAWRKNAFRHLHTFLRSVEIDSRLVRNCGNFADRDFS